MSLEPKLGTLSQEELQQVQGGSAETFAVLYAMGWRVVPQTYMDKNGMTRREYGWVPPRPA